MKHDFISLFLQLTYYFFFDRDLYIKLKILAKSMLKINTFYKQKINSWFYSYSHYFL